MFHCWERIYLPGERIYLPVCLTIYYTESFCIILFSILIDQALQLTLCEIYRKLLFYILIRILDGIFPYEYPLREDYLEFFHLSLDVIKNFSV